ncbi:formin-binding protein 1-like [Paramacrobiotus metropolitanus]|uniref:formin-binding protein 1-like n=1 Tax=Paramacrobiotus metropolitanus TaxID=2943436 RepID=UPI0024459AE9|nr:formin-binding protein 1-like [Paramacrobiotus metropolitanus]XP_055343561.1 formin-binding protein 1-like [Paramacrobiotus metropolitanus]XP_055343562.1 formin-binding protein 1-like [Paramacrobiotus metropolitanus]XP_055343563.1 formin-binding protein 1-like [Paramacrobiotus metropolitanus]XP_055343564.1 formin-binding protein 1-like [Paramacrobiotus metropolitanus]
MPADWGADLWDQYDAVAAHTSKGIDFLDRFAQFYKERCQAEVKYARDLKNIVKNFQPKKKEDEDAQYSYYRGFGKMAAEVHDLAAQHERLAEDLQTSVAIRVQAQAKELRDERKKHLEDAIRNQKHLDLHLQSLDKAKKTYEKAFKEAQRAHESYIRADENQELSRKAVEEARMAATRKQQEFETAKQEYAARLQDTNQYQRNFYQTLMPGVFQRLQELDQKKTGQIRDSIKLAVEVERRIQPIIDKCLLGMIQAAEEIVPDLDSQTVVDRYKSGFEHPLDIPFWNLEDAKSVDTGTINNHYPPIRSGSLRTGTTSASEKKQRKTIINIFPSAKAKDVAKDDFVDLPPQQRKRKIQQRIDSVNQQMHQETLTRDALMKMKGVYESNPSMGDPNSVNGQLAENADKMNVLRQELHRLQGLYDEVDNPSAANGNGNGPPAPAPTPSQPLSKGSSSVVAVNGRDSRDKSLSVSSLPGNQAGSADSLVVSTLPTLNSTTATSSRSPSESSIPAFHQPPQMHHHRHSLSDRDTDQQDLYEPAPGESDEVMGSCLALYDFDGLSEGSLAMAEGEELEILETDQGDGWTHVRRMAGNQKGPQLTEEGFVPTSYIKCTLFPGTGHAHTQHRHPHPG